MKCLSNVSYDHAVLGNRCGEEQTEKRIANHKDPWI